MKDVDVRSLSSLPRSERDFLNRAMLEASLSQCGTAVKGLTLDVGCGSRPYEKTFFSGARRYVGTDYLTDRSRPEIVCGAQELPFRDSVFDTVVCTEVLEHVPDPGLALREIRRVIKPSGSLILSTPMYWPRHEVPHDYFRYPYDGLLRLLGESGWEPENLFNRGSSYAMLGQVLMHVAPRALQPRPLVWLLNSFFLWCDRHRRNDVITMGWTVLARPVNVGAA